MAPMAPRRTPGGDAHAPTDRPRPAPRRPPSPGGDAHAPPPRPRPPPDPREAYLDRARLLAPERVPRRADLDRWGRNSVDLRESRSRGAMPARRARWPPAGRDVSVAERASRPRR